MRSSRTLGSLVIGLLLAQAAYAQPGARPPAPPSQAPPAPSTAPPAVPQGAPAAPPSAPPSGDRDDEAPAAPPGSGQAQAPVPAQPQGQPPPIAPGPPPGSLGVGAVYATPVPVWLGTEDGETPVVEIYPDWGTPSAGPPLARCRLPCGFQMQRGRYRIHVQETADTLDGDRPVSIDGAARLVITPRDRAKRTTGLVLGIGGAIAVVAGVALMIHGSSQVCDVNSCTTTWNTEATTGGFLALAGAIMTPIGWVMFGKSQRPAIDVEPTGQAVRPVRYVGFVGLPGGGGVGAKFAF